MHSRLNRLKFLCVALLNQLQVKYIHPLPAHPAELWERLAKALYHVSYNVEVRRALYKWELSMVLKWTEMMIILCSKFILCTNKYP